MSDLDAVQQDRRLIKKKIQQRRRGAAASVTQTFSDEAEDAQLDDPYDLDLLRDVQEAHQQDEEVIGGRVEDGQEDGFEAMNQAMNPRSSQWWAMRKQWQKRRGSVMHLMGLRGASDELRAALDGSHRSDPVGPDTSARSGVSWADERPRQGTSGAGAAGVVGHPVMLEDPVAMGYDVDSFRQNPFLAADKRKRAPSFVVVSRDVLQKRMLQQMMYIVAALSVVLLFMFFLQQRKLSHYALDQSPMNMAGYFQSSGMADAANGDTKLTLGDLGLEEFDEVADVPPVDFGNTAADAGAPLVGERQMPPGADPSQLRGADRLALLRDVVVGRGVTPVAALDRARSPQNQALHWLAHDDVRHYVPKDEHWIRKTVQRYALAVLYYATDGPEWTDTALFLSNFDECDWNKEREGFFLGAGHCEEGYVTTLAVWSNNLRGALPPEIGSLASLRTFAVFDNHILIPPPKSLVKLTSLKRVYIQNNDFTSSVDYLCEVMAKKEFKADCDEKGGVTCSCCSSCGYSETRDRGNMLGGW